MPDPITIVDGTLTLDIGGAQYECQVIDVTVTLPATSPGQVVPTGCGPKVTEPGDPTAGTISGTVYRDLSDAGVSTALDAAAVAGTVVTYELVLAPTVPLQATAFSGTGLVTSQVLPVALTKYGRNTFTITSADMVPSRFVAP